MDKKTEEVISTEIDIDVSEFEHVGQDLDSLNEISRPSTSFWKDAFGRIKRDKTATVFVIILIIIALLAIFVPIFSPYTMAEQHLDHMNAPMFYSDGTCFHLFGTDALGRDMFVRVFEGARVSLFIALATVFIYCVVGVVYGGIAGYFGGKVDNIMMRIAEIINGIPYLLIVILLMVVLPAGAGTIILAMALVGWVGMARLVRGEVVRLKEQEFVISSKTMGASAARIIRRHLLPNILSIVIINLTLSIPNAIFTEAFLSFIGLGVPIPLASWGTLANDGIVVFQTYPSQLIIPSFFISLTMLSFNMLGDKLRDAFDPKLRR